MDSGDYYSFSKGGTICWNLIRAGVPPVLLASQFGADEEQLRGFVESLVAQSLLRPSDAATPPQLTEIVDLRDVDLSFTQYTEMADIFAIDPIHDVDPESGWPVGSVEPHRDRGVAG